MAYPDKNSAEQVRERLARGEVLQTSLDDESQTRLHEVLESRAAAS